MSRRMRPTDERDPLREARIDLGALRSNLGILRAARRARRAVMARRQGGGLRTRHGRGRAGRGRGGRRLARRRRPRGGARAARGRHHDIPCSPGCTASTPTSRGDRGTTSTSGSARSSSSSGRRGSAERSCSSSSTPGSAATGSRRTTRSAAFARAAEHERGGPPARARHLQPPLEHLARRRRRAARALRAAGRRGRRRRARARSCGTSPSTQAAIARPDARFDLVRLGIGLYGLPPDDAVDVAALGLRPVMELAALVAAVRRVPAGTGVSYGFTHRTERDTTLALVPLGYADGVPRAASGRGRGLRSAARSIRSVGRIAMDQFLVDVGDDPVAVGDRVVLWGDPATGAPSAERLGACGRHHRLRDRHPGRSARAARRGRS